MIIFELIDLDVNLIIFFAYGRMRTYKHSTFINNNQGEILLAKEE
jgi:hypothetical protein